MFTPYLYKTSIYPPSSGWSKRWSAIFWKRTGPDLGRCRSHRPIDVLVVILGESLGCSNLHDANLFSFFRLGTSVMDFCKCFHRGAIPFWTAFNMFQLLYESSPKIEMIPSATKPASKAYWISNSGHLCFFPQNIAFHLANSFISFTNPDKSFNPEKDEQHI